MLGGAVICDAQRGLEPQQSERVSYRGAPLSLPSDTGKASQGAVPVDTWAASLGAVLSLPDDRTIDLGLVERDSIAEGSIMLRNAGYDPLVIYNVHSDCSCTVPMFPKDPVAPGDSAAIRVRYDSRGLPHGSFLKTVKLRTNAAKRPVTIFVKGRIKRD